MAKVTIDVPTESVKQLVAQLKPQELHAVLAGLQERLESLQMMALAKSAFSEWLSEEDLYSHG